MTHLEFNRKVMPWQSTIRVHFRDLGSSVRIPCYQHDIMAKSDCLKC